jgi:hypothetical protein
MASAKTLFSVGFMFPGNVCEYVPLTAKKSLLDADVIVFRPSVEPFIWNSDEWFQGKRNLSDHASFELKAAADHWRQQLRKAIDVGRAVFVFLPKLEEVLVDTGQRSYSGTGRNQRETRHVAPFSNYDMLAEFAQKIVPAEGTQMGLTDKGKFLSSYWSRFGNASIYKVMFEGLRGAALVTTAKGEVPVACQFSFEGAKGLVIALPAIAEYDLCPGDVSEMKWKEKDKADGHELVSELLGIVESFALARWVRPAPKWASANEYLLARERELHAAILEADAAIEAALTSKAELSAALEKESKLRRLLYDQGHPLEGAIIEALCILGFKAEPFKEGTSEFDAVFVSAEGRFIGEAEGKDNKAVNIDKLRQLEMNIQEDLAREDVKEPARGVLFGNAFRLQPLEERPKEYFTEKCVSSAVRTQTALVRTPDLFAVAKYVKDTQDPEFAVQCRRAILEQGGKVVIFPTLPKAEPATTVQASS